jgi:hypothetical protein
LVTRNLSKALADKILAGEEVTNADYNKVTSVGTGTAFTNDPEKTDTVFIGQMDFPIAYDGLGDEYYPNLRVTSPISVFNNTQLATYSREVCIAAVLMRPVELEEFEEKNK